MVANRKKNTTPELRVRSALHRLGLRYRVHAKPLPGVVADIVFRQARVVVFVDGCFWHGCDRHGTWPTANGPYWRAKISGNMARDRRLDGMLVAAGWKPIRVWEHDDPQLAALLILGLVRAAERVG
jgi:DNA mismatch endonuclease, patch repair protein